METQERASGVPRQVRVAADGTRVLFVRDHSLWTYEVGHDYERQIIEVGPEPIAYAVDARARLAAVSFGGALHRLDLVSRALTALPTAGPVTDPRPDPAGERIGYLSDGGLHVVECATGVDTLLAGEPEPARGGHRCVVWGVAEPTARRHFGRERGWWWAPDGRSVLAARVDRGRARPEVSLHLLHLDGGWVDVHWDRETYPYLVSVDWSDHRDPLIAVLRRPQQHGLVLAVDSRTGETQVHAELADPRWVDPIPGTPRHLADGRVLVGGELTHDGYDARCLFADGTLLTPPWLYVRRVVGRLAGGNEILAEGSAGEPSEQHLYRISTAVGAGGVDAHRLTPGEGWHRGIAGGDTLVVASRSLDHPGVRWTVWHAGTQVGELASRSGATTLAGTLLVPDLPAASTTRPILDRVTDRRLPAGVLYPASHVTGRRLPVLIHLGGLRQAVRAVRQDWTARQRWADTGFVVVVVDHRGTPGVAPSFEKVVHRRLVDLALADLADALASLAGKHPDLDLERIAVRGHGVGGWLAALAVTHRPELFRCALAESPVWDLRDYDPAFAERYLGLPEEAGEVYQHHRLAADPADPGDPTAGPGRVAGSDPAATGRVLVVGATPPDDPLFAAAPAESTEADLLGWLHSRLPAN